MKLGKVTGKTHSMCISLEHFANERNLNLLLQNDEYEFDTEAYCTDSIVNLHHLELHKSTNAVTSEYQKLVSGVTNELHILHHA